jgi:hypothetical protein
MSFMLDRLNYFYQTFFKLRREDFEKTRAVIIYPKRWREAEGWTTAVWLNYNHKTPQRSTRNYISNNKNLN